MNEFDQIPIKKTLYSTSFSLSYDKTLNRYLNLNEHKAILKDSWLTTKASLETHAYMEIEPQFDMNIDKGFIDVQGYISSVNILMGDKQ